MRPAGPRTAEAPLPAGRAAGSWTGAVCVIAIAIVAVGSMRITWDRPPLFEARFDGPNRLLTNEYAFAHPSAPDAVSAEGWQMTSGSVLIDSSEAWTGKPDSVPPNAVSTNGTNSAVFRLRTARANFRDVDVSFRLFNRGYLASASTPAVEWDGVHLLLRYQSERSLYAISLNRRDGRVAIKKKVPGGSSNGGTYYTLATARYRPRQGRWQHINARVRNTSRRHVSLELFVDGNVVLRGVDAGRAGAPLLSGGRLAIRGDNCEFRFDDFVVGSAS